MNLRLICALVALLLPAKVAFADDITVFAAASLKTALDDIAKDWQAETGHSVLIAYDSSAKLAKQISQGAPADLFISAATNWMDVLQAENLLVSGSRKNLLGNRLVLIATGPDAPPITLEPGFDLLALLNGEKLAMGMVDSVPAGQYGKQALQSLGLWDAIAPHVAQSDNVRAALALVAAGEAPLGIVYASDAIADHGKVSVIATFPETSHDPIVYPAALITTDNPVAADFLAALSGDAAMKIFETQGFTLIEQTTDG